MKLQSYIGLLPLLKHGNLLQSELICRAVQLNILRINLRTTVSLVKALACLGRLSSSHGESPRDRLLLFL